MKKILTLLFAVMMTSGVMASENVAGKISVVVGSMFTYTNDNVTYVIEKYTEEGVEKMNVTVPAFELTGTIMGNLSLGSYTVKGLVYDSQKGGYYRDYKDDGLSLHFTAVKDGVTTMDNNYTFNSSKANNILVMTDGEKVTSIVNNFQMGAMPFAITSTFTPAEKTGIETVVSTDDAADGKMYNLRGEIVGESYKGIVIRNGKKYIKQ